MIQFPIYMDYHATTPVDERVLDAMLPFYIEKFGNAASRQHKFGWIADEAVEQSRSSISKIFGAESNEIIFTSGATEANNLALKGVAESLHPKGNHIVTVQTEHKSVLDSCARLEKQGHEITRLAVDDAGVINLDDIKKSLKNATILVSVMVANNEIGTIQAIDEVGKICRERGIIFHTDATQAIGKIEINVRAMNIDLLSFSGHKIYGPKGVGALYVRNTQPKIKPIRQIDGGGHERGLRSGTLNVPGIVGLAKALEISQEEMPEESVRLARLRDKMFSAFVTELDDVYLNGHPTQRLPNNLNLSFLHVEDNALMMSMKEIAVSTGSACSTGEAEPSHVLKALKLSQERLHSSIRFSLGRFTTEEEVDYVIGRIIENVKKLRALSKQY
jgi:cysteine desulfurase